MTPLRCVFPLVFSLFASTAAAHGGFVKTDGTKLKLNNDDFFFAGANSYTMASSKSEADEQFKIASALGLNALRVWGFSNGEDQAFSGRDEYGRYVLQSRPGVFPEEAWRNLDYVVYQAHVHNFKLIIPLLNYWDEFGGIAKHLEWAGIPLPPKDPAICDSDPIKPLRAKFWTSDICKGLFKSYIDHMLNRVNVHTGVAYKDDSAIMIWEVINEPRFGPWQTPQRDPAAGPAATEVVAQWINEMAHYIKSIDKNHLVGSGEEGFLDSKNTLGRTSYPWTCGTGEGVSFAANAALDGIDVLSIHTWPFQWSISSEYKDLSTFPPEWIDEHLLIARSVKKPLYVGEFGWQILRTQGSDVLDRDNMFQKTFAHVASSEVAGLAYWHITASHDAAQAIYTGPITRKTLTQGISCKQNPVPSDDVFRFDIFCPEDTSTCQLITEFAGQMTRKVPAPDPLYVDECKDFEVLCSGICVNINDDAAHCGGCQNACAPNVRCNSGKCGTASSTNGGVKPDADAQVEYADYEQTAANRADALDTSQSSTDEDGPSCSSATSGRGSTRTSPAALGFFVLLGLLSMRRRPARAVAHLRQRHLGNNAHSKTIATTR